MFNCQKSPFRFPFHSGVTKLKDEIQKGRTGKHRYGLDCCVSFRQLCKKPQLQAFSESTGDNITLLFRRQRIKTYCIT